MFEAFYGFSADPFRLTPDRAFCFDHANFSKARAYVEYALLRGEGFVVITGHPGMGKTTLIRDLQARLMATGANMQIGLVANSRLEAEDLLRMTAHAFGLGVPVGTKSSLLIQLNAFLLTQHRAGRRVLLIIDEAQDLLVSGLEELRLLTNFEQAGKPLLQILLVGQRPLHDLIQTESLDQLRQRIVASWALVPLTPAETVGYVSHRLERAGWLGDPAFDPGVLQQVYTFSRGIPRLINLVCNRLLLRGFSLELHRLGIDDVRSVIAELHEEGLAPPEHRPIKTATLSAGLASGVVDGADSPSGASDDWSLIDQGLSRPRPSEPPASAKAATPIDQPSLHEPIAPPPTPVLSQPMGDSGPESSATPAELDAPLWHRDTSDEPDRVEDPVDESVVETWPSADSRPRRSSRVGLILFGLLLFGLAAGGGGWYWLYPETAHRLVGSARAWVESRVLPILEGREAGITTGLDADETHGSTTEVAASSPIDSDSSDPAPGSDLDTEPSRPGQMAETSEALVSGPFVEAEPRQPTELPDAEIVLDLDSMPDPDSVPVPESTLPVVTEALEVSETAANTLGNASLEADVPPEVDTVPVPEAPIQVIEPPFDPVTVDVLFDFNSIRITAAFNKDLDRIIAILDETPRTVAEVHGFSDQIGDERYNLALSRRRAESVAAYLVKRGISRERLSVEGLGPLDPTRDGVVQGMTSERASRLVRVRVLRPEMRTRATPD
ncbi:AAA family ATPase [Allochromatium palmeri]|nr:AAA family ATPase [Allochromatium palmeri]